MDPEAIEAVTTLPPAPTAPREARHFVTCALTGWDGSDGVAVAELLVCELVTNALLHARTEIGLRVVHDRGCARVEVADGSPALPVTRHAGPDATTGRGLLLLDELAVAWGVESDSASKVLWFEVGPETS
jgi:hypothetical protein